MRLRTRIAHMGLAAATLAAPLVTAIPHVADAAAGPASGKVFKDTNFSGTRDLAGALAEGGISGVTVSAYGDNNVLMGSTVTDAAGDWSINLSGPARIEVDSTTLPAGMYQGWVGRPATFLADGGQSGLDVPFVYPAEYVSPVASTYGGLGSPIAAPTATSPVGVAAESGVAITRQWGWNAPATKGNVKGIPVSSQYGLDHQDGVCTTTGALFGIAFDPVTQNNYFGATVKRNSPLGPTGSPTALFALNPGCGVWQDLNGAATPNPHLTGNMGLDDIVVDNVGREGVGGMDTASSMQGLWAVNMTSEAISYIPFSQPANTFVPTGANTFTIPNACGGGPQQSMGLTVKDGYVYVGSTCESIAASVRVQRFSEKTNTWDGAPVLSGSMPVARDSSVTLDGAGVCTVANPTPPAYRSPLQWTAWSDSPASFAHADPASTCFGPIPALWQMSATQAEVGDIDFDASGNMIIGIRNRVADMMSFNNYLIGGDFRQVGTVLAAGDIVFAARASATSYTLEASPSVTASEHFRDDVTSATNSVQSLPHAETAMGGLAVSPATGRVIGTMFDPIDCAFGADPQSAIMSCATNATFPVPPTNNGQKYSPVYAALNEQGLRYWLPAGGTATDALALTLGVTGGVAPAGSRGANENEAVGSGGFAKGNGLGDLLQYTGIAPVEIGNRVWAEFDGDGIQDGDENGDGSVDGAATATVPGNLAGVTVELVNSGGAVVATDVTDGNGDYRFYLPGTTAGSFTVRIALAQAALFSTIPTAHNASTGDESDSDAVTSGGFAVSDPIVLSGLPGQQQHHIDFGFQMAIDLELTKSTTATWAPVGGIVNFTLTPSNNGPAPAPAGWTVTEVLPPSLSLLSMSGAGYTCAGITCTAAAGLASGEVGAPITVKALVNEVGITHNVAYITPAAGSPTETNPLVIPTGATDTDLTATNNDAQADFKAVPQTGINVVKYIRGYDADTPPGVQFAPGDLMDVTFEVSNTGAIALENVVLTDNVIPGPYAFTGGDLNGDTFLDVTEVWTYEATYPAPAAGDTHYNIAKVTGDYNDPDVGTITVTDTNPGHAWTPGIPQIEVIKSINGADANSLPGVAVADGSTMNVTFDVTNIGDVPLVNVVVFDDHIQNGDIVCPQTVLAVAETMLCTATYPAPVPGFQHTNIATATGDYVEPNGQVIEVDDADPANAYIPNVPTPAIEMQKYINGNDVDGSPGLPVVAGSTMNVTFVITNTGNTDLEGVEVQDDVIDSEAIFCPADVLVAGAQMTCTATIPAPAAGTIHTNNGVVNGNYVPPVGPVQPVTAGDPANAYVLGSPQISLVKSINGDDANMIPGVFVPAGSIMNITFDVTNVGDVPLSNVRVTDDVVADANIVCPATVLAIGATFQCTATYPAPAGGVQHTNNAKVTGDFTQPNGQIIQVVDADRANAHVPGAPHIKLVKYINGNDANDAPGVGVATGSTMNIRFVVTNDGGVDLENVELVDDVYGPITCPAVTLAVGESIDCLATGPAPAAGTIHTNVGTVIADWTNPATGQMVPVTDTDPANAWTLGNPRIEVIKTINGDDANAAPGVLVAAGAPMFVQFEVTNIGDVDLSNVTVTDDIIASSAISCPKDTLAVGEVMICDATIAGPAVGAQHTNTATADGEFVQPNGQIVKVDDTDPANAYAEHLPGVDIIKFINGDDANAAPGVNVPVGSTMSITFLVTNLKPVALTNVVVTDNVVAGIVCPANVLAPAGQPGDHMTCTATAAAPAPGTVHTNVATVDADYTDVVGTVTHLTDADPANAWTTGSPQIQIIKSIDGDDANLAPGVRTVDGATMNITFEVRNTGNVPLVNVWVFDDVIDQADITCPKATLAIGEIMVCTATYPAPGPGGSHVNTAIGEGEFIQPDGTPVRVDDSDPANAYTPGGPAIDIEKFITDTDAAAGFVDGYGADAIVNLEDADTQAAAAYVIYNSNMEITYIVTNTGDVTLENVTVTDPTIGSANIFCEATILEPGEVTTCVATFPAPAPGTFHKNTGYVRGDYRINGFPPRQVRDNDPAFAYVKQIDLALVKEVGKGGVGATNDTSWVPADSATIGGAGVIRLDRPFQYRITVTNTQTGARPDSATLVNIADVVDPAIVVTGMTPAQGTCVLAAKTCDLGTIPAAGTVTIIVDAVVPSANLSQIIPAWQANDVVSTTPAVELFGINQAQVTSAHEHDIDSTPGNGFAPAEDDDNPAWVELRLIDLEVVKSINTVDTGIDYNDAATRQIAQNEITTGTLPVAIGTEATWSIKVTNRGPSTGTGVTVLDALPAEFLYVSSSSANGSYDPATNIWTVGALSNGQSATLNIVAILVPAWSFDQTALPTRNVNVAEVAGANEDDIDSTPGDSVVAADDIDDAFADSIVGSLGDLVWHDVNGDGVQQAGEPGLAGVPVTLTYTSSITDSAGTVVVPAGAVVTAVTDANGFYLFTNLYGGTYDVKVTVPAGMVVTGKDAGSNNAVDSDADPAGLISASLLPGTSDLTFDAGVYFPASIGNFVWEDMNGNGVQDAGEPAIVGATVMLTGEAWVAGVNLTAVTDSNGFYLFDGLRPGPYHVSVISPVGYSPTVQNVGGDDAVDSDPNTAGVMVSTDLISGENDPTWDAGLVRPVAVGDFVWNDHNRNGQQDAGEPGVAAVTVHLTGVTGTGVSVSASITTAADGSYLFDGLLPGVYTVKFDVPNTYKTTGQDVGGDSSDSDADTSGLTVPVTLASGDKNLTVDAGLVELVDLQVVKTGKITDKGSHRPAHDATVEWKMVVTNNGPAVVAAGATLTDTLPAGLTFDDMVVPAGWSCPTVPVVGAESGSIGCISSAAMVVGASVTFVVHEHVSVSFDDAWKAAEPGAKVADFKNGATVQVVLSQFDINEPNNVSDDLVELIKTPTPTGSEILPVLLVAGFAATAGFGLFFVGRRRRTV